MIFLFLLISMAVILWLPWWALCVLCLVFGLLHEMKWKKAAAFALLIAAAEFGLAAYFDHQDQGLIGLRMGGLFSVPHWAIYFLPAGVGAWIALFFARLGTSLRVLLAN